MDTIILKRWIYDKISADAMKYNRYIDCKYFDGYYVNKENDTVSAIGEVIKETEKAMQIKFATGYADGSCKGWIAWVPKSQIVK